MSNPMTKSSDLSSRERVQRLYTKNVELENRRRKAAHARIPSDPNAWQQMRENYEAIVVEDNAFSEQHEIEYALWQLHYRRIEELRGHLNAAIASAGLTTSQDGKGPIRPGPDRITKIRSQFKTFLSEASGFYHDMMLKIRAKCGLPPGYDQENLILSQDGNMSAEMKRGLIACQRCLIYLGDLARYKGLYVEVESKARDFAAASSYYIQASSLWPSSGNPHHQLAILALYSGDELVAIYRYFRSLAVDKPFSTARDNLIIAFEKNRQSYSQLPGNVKASVKMGPARMTAQGRGKGDKSVKERAESNLVKERASSILETFKAFCIRFVRLNGILFTRTSLETFEEVYSIVRGDLLELLASGPHEECTFGSDAAECSLVVVRVIAILIFSAHNVNRETENQSYAEILQRSLLLQNVFTAIFEFMGLILERCIQLNDPSTSYLLPGIMVFVEWLACRQDIAVGSAVEEKQASARSFFWNHFVSFSNKLLSIGFSFIKEEGDGTCFFNMSRYDESETANRLALFEDIELRGFLPLLPAQLFLDFSMKNAFGSNAGSKGKNARVQRIIAAGKALANVIHVEQQTLYFDYKSKRFAFGAEPQMLDDYSHTGSWDIPRENGGGQEISSESQLNLGPQLCIEGDEEDEVIVFKPVLSEKDPDGVASNLTSSQILGSSVDNSYRVVDLECRTGAAVSVPNDGFLLQDSYETCLRQPTSLANITPPPYFQPSASTWLGEQVSTNEQHTQLSLSENGFPMKREFQHHLIPQQSFNPNASNKYAETILPCKFDSIMPLGKVLDSLSMKTSPMLPAGMRKNPVSRPVRHAGPPPGFNSVPTKLVDESSLSGVTLKNYNPPVDNYRWLDGYQFASLTSQGMEIIKDSINQSAANGYHQPGSKINSSLGMVSFPFPGFQVPEEKQKGWNEYQFLESLSLHQKQQQFQKGNPNSFVALPEQYQGQTFLEKGFFV